MANDCIHRRGVFRHGTSNLALSPADDPFSNGTLGDPETSSATSPYSSPPPEYTEIEFKVEYCKISLILVYRLRTYGSDQIYSTAINNRVNRSRSKHGYKIQSFLFLWIKAKPSYYHLPSYEDAVKIEEGEKPSESGAGDDTWTSTPIQELNSRWACNDPNPFNSMSEAALPRVKLSCMFYVSQYLFGSKE